MHLRQYLLTKRGDVNGLFGFITPPLSTFSTNIKKDRDYYDNVEALILAELRHDREENLIGNGIPDKNPSLPPSVVEYYFTPCMERQRLYAQGFPIKQGTHTIIDAFVCLGSRFDLKQLQCFVEVCRSDFGGETRWWANIYYTYDSVVPAAIIETHQLDSHLDDNFIQGLVDESRARRDRMQKRLDREETNTAS